MSTSKIVETTFTLQKHLEQNYNALEVSTTYSSGGYNWYSGAKESSGMFLALRPMDVSNGTRSFLMFDDSAYKIKICDASRNSKKKLQSLFEKAEQNIDKIVELFKTDDKDALLGLVKNF